MAIRRLTISYLLVCIYIASWGQSPGHYDVIIDELFPDPSPPIGLPDAEFIELKNVSATAYNLRNWKISNSTNTVSIKTDFILQPDSFLILCSASNAASYSNFGATVGIAGFPSLDNTNDTIRIQSPEGITIHAVAYNKTWYRNEVKSDGGWTLEMIDTRSPCGGYSNWNASNANEGGTPGKKNSIDGINTDQQMPALLRTYTIDNTMITAVFDEPLDSVSAATITNYEVNNGIGSPVSAFPVTPLFSEVQLRFSTPMQENRIYGLTVNNITDCAGNAIGMMNTTKAGSPSLPDTMDIVINEILFNPATNGYDYVELYNRSNKVIDCKQLFVANRTVTGTLNNITPLSSSSFLFFPGEYYVITENGSWLMQNYIVKNRDKIIELSSLPSLPDDHGNIQLLNREGKIIDALEYDHKWHLALIDNEQGIALERINYNKPTQDQTNWTSAASTAGFGTPTYQNSQFMADQQAKGMVSITSKIFSPDNDGYEDYCFINYQVPASGYIANISIFDATGRLVRYLSKNATLGLTGNFRWDGLDDSQKKLPMGIYIIQTEIFNLNGYTKKFKEAVTLAKRLSK